MALRKEESGQLLENVDRTHLVQASGKLVLQKVKLLRLEGQGPIVKRSW